MCRNNVEVSGLGLRRQREQQNRSEVGVVGAVGRSVVVRLAWMLLVCDRRTSSRLEDIRHAGGGHDDGGTVDVAAGPSRRVAAVSGSGFGRPRCFPGGSSLGSWSSISGRYQYAIRSSPGMSWKWRRLRVARGVAC